VRTSAHATASVETASAIAVGRIGSLLVRLRRSAVKSSWRRGATRGVKELGSSFGRAGALGG